MSAPLARIAACAAVGDSLRAMAAGRPTDDPEDDAGDADERDDEDEE